MEDQLNAKMKEVASSHANHTGVMLVDKYGLIVES